MNPLEPLVNQLKKCPGLGEKSAQRIAFFLISISQGNVDAMAKTMVETRANIRYCDTCFNISFESRCHVCKNPKRDGDILCVVAEPKDIFAIERTGSYQGVYHVLGGLLSPLDGIQPESLRIKELIQRIGQDTYKEIIFAINPTVEGDSTVMYISSLLEPFQVNITRLAYGLPMGSDIDYADEVTLSKAISARRELV